MAEIRKLLMTTDTVGGVWQYVIELAREMGKHGVQIVLASMGPRAGKEQKMEIASLKNIHFVESDFPLEWMDNSWTDVMRAGSWLLKMESDFQPDILHLNGYSHAALEWHAPVLVAGHSCVYSWFHAVKQDAPPSHWKAYHDHVCAGLRGATRVVAPSHAMMDALHFHYRFSSPSQVIYNARSSFEYFPREKKPYIFTAGRFWDEGKNVAALNTLKEKPAWPVYAAGDGANVSRNSGVVWLGKLGTEKMKMWLGHAAIYALPAKYEPFGLSILEAALCGCALVLGDIPSLRELWNDAAIFVDPEDREQLSWRLRQLIDDVSLRAKFSSLAQIRAGHFPVRKMGDSYMLLYNQMLHSCKKKSQPDGTGMTICA